MDLPTIIAAFFIGTYTQADARRRLNILDIVVEEATYKTSGKKSIEELIHDRPMTDADRAALVSFIHAVTLPSSISDLKKVFTGLRDEIIKRPLVTLTVAFEPSAEQISVYGDWFRKNLHPHALMTIVFSAAVVGGCSITWQGKQVTYDVEYLLKAKRKEILTIVDKFVEIKKKEKVI